MSTDEKSSRQTALEEAKKHDQPLGGAQPMPGPGQQPMPQQAGHPIPPGMQQGGMVYDPRMQPPPGAYPPMPGYPQQGFQGYPGYPQQPQQFQPGQGMPMQQFVQGAAGAPVPGRPRPKEAVQADMKALSEAVQREAQKQAAIPPEAEEDEAVELDSTQTTVEDENLFLGSMDAEMDSAIDKFNNSRRRKRIEKDLPKMNVEDLALHGELRQKVKISAGIVVEYRTTSGLENQGILQELGKIDGSELYLRERLALMNLAAGLHAVGGELMPSHIVDDDFDEEAFAKKLKRVLRFPIQILADMRVNYYWFDDRVRNIMIAEELGNG